MTHDLPQLCEPEELPDAMLREINRLRAEVARLQGGGCARNQGLTQYCAEAVELQKENAKLRELLRDVMAHDEITGWTYASDLYDKIYAALGEKK
jgi:hypothetical protein